MANKTAKWSVFLIVLVGVLLTGFAFSGTTAHADGPESELVEIGRTTRRSHVVCSPDTHKTCLPGPYAADPPVEIPAEATHARIEASWIWTGHPGSIQNNEHSNMNSSLGTIYCQDFGDGLTEPQYCGSVEGEVEAGSTLSLSIVHADTEKGATPGSHVQEWEVIFYKEEQIPDASCVSLESDIDLSQVELGDIANFTIIGQNEDNYRAEVNGTEIVSGTANFAYTFNEYGTFNFQAWVHGPNGWVNGSQCAESATLTEEVQSDFLLGSSCADDNCGEVNLTNFGPNTIAYRFKGDEKFTEVAADSKEHEIWHGNSVIFDKRQLEVEIKDLTTGEVFNESVQIGPCAEREPPSYRTALYARKSFRGNCSFVAEVASRIDSTIYLANEDGTRGEAFDATCPAGLDSEVHVLVEGFEIQLSSTNGVSQWSQFGHTGDDGKATITLFGENHIGIQPAVKGNEFPAGSIWQQVADEMGVEFDLSIHRGTPAVEGRDDLLLCPVTKNWGASDCGWWVNEIVPPPPPEEPTITTTVNLPNTGRADAGNNTAVAEISFADQAVEVVDLDTIGQNFGWDEAGRFGDAIGIHRDASDGSLRAGASLPNLAEGQIVRVVEDGQVKLYRVEETKVIERSLENLSEITENDSDLTLFTCYGSWTGSHYTHYYVVTASLVAGPSLIA